MARTGKIPKELLRRVQKIFGDKKSANTWIHSPSTALGRKTPYEVLRGSSRGCARVEKLVEVLESVPEDIFDLAHRLFGAREVLEWFQAKNDYLDHKTPLQFLGNERQREYLKDFLEELDLGLA